MKCRALLTLCALLIAAPAFAAKVYVEFDPEYDGSQNKTYAWKATEGTSLMETSPLLHSKIITTISGYVDAGGYEQVDENPDIYITYHGSSKDEMKVDTTSYGYGYPSSVGYGRYGGYGGYHGSYYGGSYGGGVSTATVRTYKVGTLVVDVLDAKTDTLVWRGIAADIVVSDNPQKVDKAIQKSLRKMVNKWQKMKKSTKKKG